MEMEKDQEKMASENHGDAATCGPSPGPGCSVRFILMGLNTFSVRIAIRPFFATEADARKEEARYRKFFCKPANADHNGWKDFCVVKRTTTEEVCTQNPTPHQTAHGQPQEYRQ